MRWKTIMLTAVMWSLMGMTTIHADQWVQEQAGWKFEKGAVSVKSAWEQIDGKWYAFDGNGYMRIGWYQEGSIWYYLNPDGSMRTGWLQDTNGKWYYLNANGSMAVSTIIDGFKIGSDGVWIEKPATRYTAGQIKNQNLTSYTAGTRSVYGPKLNQTELDQVAEAVASFVNTYAEEDMNTIEKILIAHDYLASVCSYAPTWAENQANTAWGALVYHEAQCSGYARAMKALCDALGVNCYYVHADENAWNPSHQWNMVEVDGKWYIVDVQANDSSGGYFFFLCGSEDYIMTYDKTKYPECSPTSYDFSSYY